MSNGSAGNRGKSKGRMKIRGHPTQPHSGLLEVMVKILGAEMIHNQEMKLCRGRTVSIRTCTPLSTFALISSPDQMSLEVMDVHRLTRIDSTLEGCKPFMYLIVHLRLCAGQYCVIHLVSAKQKNRGGFPG